MSHMFQLHTLLFLETMGTCFNVQFPQSLEYTNHIAQVETYDTLMGRTNQSNFH
jgi:hypothetical protein